MNTRNGTLWASFSSYFSDFYSIVPHHLSYRSIHIVICSISKLVLIFHKRRFIDICFNCFLFSIPEVMRPVNTCSLFCFAIYCLSANSCFRLLGIQFPICAGRQTHRERVGIACVILCLTYYINRSTVICWLSSFRQISYFKHLFFVLYLL